MFVFVDFDTRTKIFTTEQCEIQPMFSDQYYVQRRVHFKIKIRNVLIIIYNTSEEIF